MPKNYRLPAAVVQALTLQARSHEISLQDLVTGAVRAFLNAQRGPGGQWLHPPDALAAPRGAPYLSLFMQWEPSLAEIFHAFCRERSLSQSMAVTIALQRLLQSNGGDNRSSGEGRGA